MQGRLIVFEGIDGCGKTTQFKRMSRRLAEEGHPVREIDFPRYGRPFAEPARLYLAGVLGSRPGDVNAYAASTFYAVDRYASYKEDWGAAYEAGGLILANRYTTSNAVHQASKLPAGERREYLEWLFDLEYRRLELPQPDLVFYLDLPTELSLEMIRRRSHETGAGTDIHEQDEVYLRRCRESARDIASALGWRRIDCAKDGTLRTVEDIHRELWGYLRAFL